MTLARPAGVSTLRLVVLAGCGGPAARGPEGNLLPTVTNQVVCGGPIAVQPDERIEGCPMDFSVQKNLAQSDRAARSALESKRVDGDIPPTP